MILRHYFLEKIKKQFAVHRIVAVLGPRQCGKTTLARHIFGDGPLANYFDLESLVDLERIEQSPQLVLQRLSGLVVIDEVQRLPNLFALLRYIHDAKPDIKFLILGSASRDLIRQSSESLAGRIGYIELPPFMGFEVDDIDKLWLQGGFPSAFLAQDLDACHSWLDNYIRTFLEQDVPSLGFRIEPAKMRRFWMLLAHYHGQVINFSEIANNLDISAATVKRYLDILAGTFMIRLLQPWYENIAKRQVKAPKLYFRDSGLLHALLGVSSFDDLLRHRILGASWEGFALEQVIWRSACQDVYFWSSHGVCGVDLLCLVKGRRIGFEFKHTDRPRKTASMVQAMQNLKLDELSVIYPGPVSFPLTESINAVALHDFLQGGKEKI